MTKEEYLTTEEYEANLWLVTHSAVKLFGEGATEDLAIEDFWDKLHGSYDWMMDDVENLGPGLIEELEGIKKIIGREV